MSVSQVLEVLIGLIVIYYILGSVVSMVTRWINDFFESRGRALEQYLIRLVGDRKIEDLKNLPQIQALRPIRYKGVFSVFRSVTEPKMIEKIPLATLVDSFFDISGLTAKKEMNLLELAEVVDKLPDSDGKRAFIKWINQGVTNIEDLRKRTTDYFCGVLDQAAETFRARARSFVIILSIGITLLLGTDSIQLAQALWKNAELRSIAVVQADVVVAEGGTSADLSKLLDDLSKFSIKIGWWEDQQFPQNSDVMAWASFVFLKVLGLGITAAAVSQGSSFWYDLLKKVRSPVSSTSDGGSASG